MRLSIQKLGLSLSLSFLLFILMLGWDQSAFTNRLLTLVVDTGITIDEEIPRPEYQSTSHRVYWRGDIESIDLKESSGLAYNPVRPRGDLVRRSGKKRFNQESDRSVRSLKKIEILVTGSAGFFG